MCVFLVGGAPTGIGETTLMWQTAVCNRPIANCGMCLSCLLGLWLLAGTYNDALNANKSAPCKSCPVGTTTDIEGATSVHDCKRK